VNLLALFCTIITISRKGRGGEEEEVEEEGEEKGEPSFPIPAFNNFNHVGGSIEVTPYSI
jgi:hypothetical protein